MPWLVSEWSVEHAPGTATEAAALESLGMGPLGATDTLSKDAESELVTRVLIAVL